MEATEFITIALGRLPRTLHVALDGATPAQLTEQPGDQSNTIAWLVWHLTRIQDRVISELAGREQAWVTDGWCQQFGRAADASETGMGWPAERATDIQPESAQLLWDYYEAVAKRTAVYLQGVKPGDLDRQLDPANAEATVGFRLAVCLSDNVQHAGQAAYLRGLIEGKKVYPS